MSIPKEDIHGHYKETIKFGTSTEKAHGQHEHHHNLVSPGEILIGAVIVYQK